MSKKTCSVVCVMLSVAMLFSMTAWAEVAVSAKEVAVQPRYSYTNYTSTGLSISANGTAVCHADAEGYRGTTTEIYIKMVLQRKTANGWSNYATWQDTFYNFYGTLDRSLTVPTGTYRVRATYIVYSGTQSEIIPAYSGEETYS